MTGPDTSGWKFVGEAGNSRYFAVNDRVLAAVPAHGSVDDLATAQQNVTFQNEYFRSTRPGVVAIFFDNLASQDKDARRVYQSGPVPTLMLGSALVGGTLLSRAMGSFFLGLSKPKIPVKMFASLDAALVWADKIVLAHLPEQSR